MSDTLTWEIWSGSPWLSMATWLVLGVSLATLARPIVRRVSQRVFRVIRYTFARLGARMQALANRIQQRNAMMIMTLDKSFLERQIYRQNLQLQEALTHDLAQVEPQGAQLSKLIERMEDDYAATRETVTEPPEWFRATESLLESKAAQTGNRTLEHLLEQLLQRVQTESRLARQDYRQAVMERHQLLSQFLPYWRRLLRMQGEIGQGVRRIEQRAERLEALIMHHEALSTDPKRSLQHAVGSVLVHSSVAACVMLGVLMLAIGSFWSFSAGTQLILPQVSVGNVVMMSVALMSAQALTGLVLLENIQVTRLFRGFWAVDGQTSRWLRRSALLAMGLWSLLNGTLAFLATSNEHAVLGMGATSTNAVLAVRVLLAALTPWLLILVVIPLEPLLNGLRIVSGQLLVLVVSIISWALRLAGVLVRVVEQLWLGLYDLICAPAVNLMQMQQRWWSHWQLHQQRKQKQKKVMPEKA